MLSARAQRCKMPFSYPGIPRFVVCGSQGGPAGNASRLHGMAAGSDGQMVLAGYTDGSWDDNANLGSDDFLAVMLNTIAVTPAPSSVGGDPIGGPTSAPSTPAAAAPATSSRGGDHTSDPTGAPSTPAATTPAPSSARDSPIGGFTVIARSNGSTSSTAPIIAGAVSTVAIVVLSAAGFLLRRRRAAKNNGAGGRDPSIPPIDGLEDGQLHGVSLSKSSVTGGGDNPTLHQNNYSPPANRVKFAGAAAIGGGVAASSATEVGGSIPFCTSQPTHAGKAGGVALADGAAEDCSAKQRFVVATTSTADASTLDRAEVAGILGEEAALSAGGPKPAASAAGRRGSCNDVGVGRAVMTAAQELAQRCQIPGVSEAAAMVSILVNLVADSRDSTNKGNVTLKQCRSIVMALERAAAVAGEVSKRHGSLPLSFSLAVSHIMAGFRTSRHQNRSISPMENAHGKRDREVR